MSNKEIRRELRSLRKLLIYFEINTKKFNWQLVKEKFKRNEISIFTFILTFLGITLLPFKSQLYWLLAFVKADLGGAAVAVGAGVGVTATTIMLSSINSTPPSTISIDKPAEVVKMYQPLQECTPIKEKVVDPIFKPKYAKVIKLDAEVIEGKITDFNSDYIRIEFNGNSQKIPQADIYKIEW